MSNREDQTATAHDYDADDYALMNASQGTNQHGTNEHEVVAEDLKSILKLIATQLQDTDRRQTEVLGQMQQRLEELGSQTKTSKARVPAAYVPAFERIQDGIHLLIERISENRTDPVAAAATEAPIDAANDVREAIEDMMAEVANAPDASPDTDDALPDGDGDITAQSVGQDEALPAASEIAFSQSTPTASEKMPLRSALNEDQAEHMPVSDPAGTDGIDAFDMIDSGGSPDVGEPWDAEQAEALTQVYEAGETADPEMPMEAVSFTAPLENEQAETAQQADLPATATPVPAVDFDRSWLQDRFAEIAERVEHSLAEMRPDDSLFAINDRMERMQDSITEALETVATRQDLDTLKSEEFPVDELISHLERADQKLDRINSIEDKLAMVQAQLSDERFNILVSQFASESPSQSGASEADFDRIANVAAEAVAERFAGMVDRGAETPVVSELREMLERFIEDQRKDNVETAGSLDTIQQAMINILDRVETIEMSEPAFEDEPAPAPIAGMAMAAMPIADSNAAAMQGNDDTTMIVHRPEENGSQNFAADAPVFDPHAYDPEKDDNFDSAADLPRSVDAAFQEPGYDNGDAAGAPGSELPPMNAIDRIRQDFIADAQRAKVRTAAQADASGAASGYASGLAADSNDAPAARKSLLSGLRGGKKAKSTNSHSEDMEAVLSGSTVEGAAAGSTIFGIRRNTLLIGAFVTLVAVTSALMLMRKDTARPAAEAKPPAAIEQSINDAPNAAASSSEQPNIFDGETNSFEPLPSGTGDRSQVIDGPMPSLDGTSVGPLASANGLPGIEVQPSRRNLTPREIAHIENRRSMAKMSSELGTQAATADHAELMQQFGVSTSATSEPTPAETAKAAVTSTGLASKLNLPPATVGPLSLRLAAAKGDPSAQFEVGARLAEGKGTAQNFLEAAKWYSRSAEQGFAQSKYRLGTLFERGLGVKKDLSKAAAYYQQAASLGNIKAMHNLAVLSAGSADKSPDYLTAAHWFSKAADYGLTDSQYNLAVLFENGLGVKKSPSEAFKFFTLSAKSGDTEAVRRREELRTKMSEADVKAAELMIANWRRKTPDKLANDARAAGEHWKSRANGGYSS